MFRSIRSGLSLSAAFTFGAALVPAAAFAQNPAVTIMVDATANLRAISPLIYGAAFASAAPLRDLNMPLNRSGGNRESTYNYQNNATNTAADYFFESIPDSLPAGFSGPGASLDSFVSDTRSASAQPILTVPLLDWVAAINGSGHPYKHSFSIAKYGAQKNSDPYETDAGNGKLASNGSQITGNKPTDAYVASSAAYQQGLIAHLVGKWGKASASGVRYYGMDNEPSLWHTTHVDVHPNPPPMQEIYDKTVAYSAMIKAQDASAQILGPEEWSYYALTRSGLDQANNNDADNNAHGGIGYAPWLLQTLHTHDATSGIRSLDVFTTHYYPQGGEAFSGTDATTQALRNRSTRSLWDPNYVDESWQKYIGNGKIMLIPRMKNWVNTYYPDLKTGITEYNWGPDDYIGGATAQADVLGILGREGTDMATRWVCPAAGTATYNAFKMYRNYDGANSTFGETSVSASGPNPDNVAVFGATRAADGALTVMVISKNLTGNTPATINLTHFAAGTMAQAWQLTNANAITPLASVPITGGAFAVSLPPLSVTLYVVPPAAHSVSGFAHLEGIVAAASAQNLTFAFRPTDGGATITKTASVAPSGAFSLSGLPAKSYSLRVSGARWLAVSVPVNAAGGNVSGVSVTLPAGDANGDNSVDTTDFGLLVGSYGSSVSVPGSGYDASADFNCDGSVDTTGLWPACRQLWRGGGKLTRGQILAHRALNPLSFVRVLKTPVSVACGVPGVSYQIHTRLSGVRPRVLRTQMRANLGLNVSDISGYC